MAGCGLHRLDHHPQSVVSPETYLAAGQADDAWIAGPEHLELRAAAQTELFEPMNVIGRSDDLGDPGAVLNGKLLQRYDFGGWYANQGL